MLVRVFYCCLLALVILLSTLLSNVALSDATFNAQNLVLTQGDVVVANRITARSIAVADDLQLWPNGIIPFTIDSALPLSSRAAALVAIERWNEVGGISLMPLDEVQQSSAVSITDSINFLPGDFCASWVGRRGGRQEVWVSDNCAAGSVMHEIGHVLGLEHEHTRPDRDQYITIHWDNITPDKQHNFDTAPVGSRLPGAYDYASIMHYGTHNFSGNGRATISSADGVTRITGQRTAPSDGDIAAIASLYGSDLTLVSQWVDAAEQSELEVYVSNVSSQGAHDITLELDAALTLATQTPDADSWECVADALSDVTRCSLAQLPGSGVQRLVFAVAALQSPPSINLEINSKTPDLDLTNNQSSTSEGINGIPGGAEIPPQLFAAAVAKEPIQDDVVTHVTVGGGASRYDMLVVLLLLFSRQTGGRVDFPTIFCEHRRYLLGRQIRIIAGGRSRIAYLLISLICRAWSLLSCLLVLNCFSRRAAGSRNWSEEPPVEPVSPSPIINTTSVISVP